jgi:hypothetical protein
MGDERLGSAAKPLRLAPIVGAVLFLGTLGCIGPTKEPARERYVAERDLFTPCREVSDRVFAEVPPLPVPLSSLPAPTATVAWGHELNVRYSSSTGGLDSARCECGDRASAMVPIARGVLCLCRGRRSRETDVSGYVIGSSGPTSPKTGTQIAASLAPVEDGSDALAIAISLLTPGRVPMIAFSGEDHELIMSYIRSFDVQRVNAVAPWHGVWETSDAFLVRLPIGEVFGCEHDVTLVPFVVRKSDGFVCTPPGGSRIVLARAQKNAGVCVD